MNIGKLRNSKAKKLENNIRFYESISGTPDLAEFHEQHERSPRSEKSPKSRFENCIVKLIGIREYEFIYFIFMDFASLYFF